MNALSVYLGDKKAGGEYTYICADTVRNITSAVMVKQTEGIKIALALKSAHK